MTIVILLYFLSFGLLFLNHGVYLDDWVIIVGRNQEFISNVLGHQAGIIIASYILLFASYFRSYAAYRIITFFAYLLSGYFFYAVLKTVKEINSKSRLLLTIFFLLFPANDARIALIVFHYSISNFFFYFGLWLTSLYFYNRRLLIRIFALLAFFLSFNIISFLFFYILVLVYIIYIEKHKLNSWMKLQKLMVYYWDFILLPFIFYAWKSYYFRPFGMYEGYNEINPLYIVIGMFRSIEAYWFSFILVLISSIYSLFNLHFSYITSYAISNLNYHSLLDSISINNVIEMLRNSSFNTVFFMAVKNISNEIIDTIHLCMEIVKITTTELKNHYLIPTITVASIGIISIFTVIKKTIPIQTLKNRNNADFLLFILGCLFFYVAVFPYYAVNKSPSIIGAFDDRHLLLVPLGASFMLVYGIRIVCRALKCRREIYILLYSICIAMFISYHIRINLDYLRDWYKQVSIMEQMKSKKEFNDKTTFLFKDNTIALNVYNRTYHFYEYASLMKAVFGNERRFGSDVRQFRDYNNSSNELQHNQYIFSKNNQFKKYFTTMYNMGEYNENNPEYLVEINLGTFELSDISLIHLLYDEYANKEEYRRNIKNIVELSLTPINMEID